MYHCYEKWKKSYLCDLKWKHITEKKGFWKNVKSLWSNRAQSCERVKLAKEDDSLITKGVCDLKWKHITEKKISEKLWSLAGQIGYNHLKE